MAAVLKSAGITENEVGSYVRKLEQGDLVILANAEVPRQPYSDECDAGFSNAEQSMQYESSLNKGNTNASPPLNQQEFTTHEKTRGLYDEDVQHSYVQNKNQQLQGHTDFSYDGAQTVTKEEI